MAAAVYHDAGAGTPNQDYCANNPEGDTVTRWQIIAGGGHYPGNIGPGSPGGYQDRSTLGECKQFLDSYQTAHALFGNFCHGSSTSSSCVVYDNYPEGTAYIDPHYSGGKCNAVCVPPEEQCPTGEVRTVGQLIYPGQTGTVVHRPTGVIGGCAVKQVGDAGCGDQTFDEIYASMPKPYRSGGTGKMHYGVAYCTTGLTEGEDITDPVPAPAADEQAGDLEAPYTEIEQPNSGSTTSPVTSETNGDGSVTDTQTETEWEDYGSGETLDYAEGSVSVVEFASYDDGRIDVETVTQTTTYPDGTVVETVTTTTTERGAQTVETTVTPTGVTEVVQGGSGTVITMTTTTTQTNPDGSSSSTTSTSSGTDTDGDGEPDEQGGGGGNGDGDGDGNGEGGGSGEFQGTGLGGVNTVAESWATITGLADDPSNVVGALTQMADTIPTGGECPRVTFDTGLLGVLTLESQCDLAEANYDIIHYAFLAVWVMTFGFIVLGD